MYCITSAESSPKYFPSAFFLHVQIFEAKQGWEPLCQFLGLPVPSSPFPRSNDTGSMLNILKALRVISLMALFGLPTVLGLALYWLSSRM